MAQYKLTPDTVKMLRRRLIRNGVLLMLLVLGIGVVTSNVRSDSLVVVIPSAVLAMSIGLLFSYRRTREQFLSFEILTTPDQITRQMLGVPPVTLHKEDVVRIDRHASGEITVHCLRPAESIRIPFEIERREDLLAELALWRAAEEGKPIQSQFWWWATSIATLVAFAAVELSTNRLIIVVVGTSLVLSLFTCPVLIWRNRQQLDARVRWLAFILILPGMTIVIQLLIRVVAAWRGA